MHVVALKDHISPSHTLRLGRMYDMPKGQASILIRRQLVMQVPDSEPVVERAIVEPQETAVPKTRRRGRPRKNNG